MAMLASKDLTAAKKLPLVHILYVTHMDFWSHNTYSNHLTALHFNCIVCVNTIHVTHHIFQFFLHFTYVTIPVHCVTHMCLACTHTQIFHKYTKLAIMALLPTLYSHIFANPSFICTVADFIGPVHFKMNLAILAFLYSRFP